MGLLHLHSLDGSRWFHRTYLKEFMSVYLEERACMLLLNCDSSLQQQFKERLGQHRRHLGCTREPRQLRYTNSHDVGQRSEAAWGSDAVMRQPSHLTPAELLP